MGGDAAFTLVYALYSAGLAVAVLVGLYALYWSIALRRAMRVTSYGRQELLVGLFSLYGVILMLLFYLLYYLAPGLQTTPLWEVHLVLYVVLPPILLAWADSSIMIGRRTDPLLRDPMNWSRLRWAFWGLMALGVFVAFLPNPVISSLGVNLAFLLLSVVTFPVLISARRSGDPFYRMSIRWFGQGLAALVLMNVGFNLLITFVNSGVGTDALSVSWALFANAFLVPATFYAVFRCARSFVPLNRIGLD